MVGDLELAAMCGLPPFVDELIDVFIDEGMIVVGVPRLFTRPLRLNSVEAFELLAAARTAMELPGADPDGALARGLAKLASTLGRRRHRRASRSTSTSQSWSTGWRPPRPATSSSTIDYVGADRDESTIAADRAPAGVHRSRRVVRAAPTTTDRAKCGRSVSTASPRWHRRRDRGAERRAAACARGLVRRRIGAAGRAAAVAGGALGDRALPGRHVEAPDDAGWTRVTLPVASEQWLVKTMLRLGPEAELVEPADLRDVVTAAAGPGAGPLPPLVERIEISGPAT